MKTPQDYMELLEECKDWPSLWCGNNIPTEWLKENCHGKWRRIISFYYFEKQQDYLLAKLTWTQ